MSLPHITRRCDKPIKDEATVKSHLPTLSLNYLLGTTYVRRTLHSAFRAYLQPVFNLSLLELGDDMFQFHSTGNEAGLPLWPASANGEFGTNLLKSGWHISAH